MGNQEAGSQRSGLVFAIETMPAAGAAVAAGMVGKGAGGASQFSSWLGWGSQTYELAVNWLRAPVVLRCAMVGDGDRLLAVGREDDAAAFVGVDDLVEVVAAEVDLLDWLAGVLHSK